MPEKASADSGYNYLILIPTMLLICLGLVMIYSASSNLGQLRLGDGYFFLKRQAIFCLIGIPLMFVARYIPYTLYSKFVYPLLIISACLLGLLYVPALAREIGGAHRWLHLGPFPFNLPNWLSSLWRSTWPTPCRRRAPKWPPFPKGFCPTCWLRAFLCCLFCYSLTWGPRSSMGLWVLIALFVGGVRIFHITSIFTSLFSPGHMADNQGRLQNKAVAGLPGPVGRPHRHRVPDHSLLSGLRVRGDIRGRAWKQ